ncbi:hypothetical protein DL769_001997 [Monosporascus sp. CRB-8-3]|nr:hypothetical protein DL769_001997 [Monosporascus sp. CRB-8-3]
MGAATSPVALRGRSKAQESWENIQDARERKKVQNRIAQRGYRERARKRVETLERLYFEVGDFFESRDEGSESRPVGISCGMDAYPDIAYGSTAMAENASIPVGCGGPPVTIGDSNGDTSESRFASAPVKNTAFETTIAPNGTEIEAVGNGKTALHIAAESGNVDMLRFLMELKADPLARDKLGRTALHIAVEQGQESAVLELSRDQRIINAQALDGQTALHAAASLGNTRLVHQLIAAGSCIEAKDASGRTSLHLAVTSGNQNVLKILVEKGADINAPINI